MEINREQMIGALSLFKFIYPKFSENFQEWNPKRKISFGFLYFVKKNNKIIQIFAEFDETYLNEVRIVRILKKRKVIPDLDFIILNTNNRWRIGWKV